MDAQVSQTMATVPTKSDFTLVTRLSSRDKPIMGTKTNFDAEIQLIYTLSGQEKTILIKDIQQLDVKKKRGK